MSLSDESVPRIASLDVVRGVAVMGILAMNIVAFSMPFQAYMNPTVYGLEGPADYWSWAASFILVDGKMRGLFSFLFGASTLLVIERARSASLSPASVHYRRMAWLLVFGLLHFYLIWFGDILSGYALIGLILFLFRNLSTRALFIWGVAFVTIQLVVFAAMAASIVMLEQVATLPNADPQLVMQWQTLEQQFGSLTGQPLADKLALHRGAWTALVEHRVTVRGADPFFGIFVFGWETLGFMLLGMAALKNGFLTGGWSDSRYRRAALAGFGIAIPAYAFLAWAITRDGFSIPMIFVVVFAATVPFRPLMIVGYAALIILLTRKGGALVDRIAAAGRAAFTNYLGTSLVMTTIFYGYGFGLYGDLSRAQLWLAVIAGCALMLAWSKWWLDRFRYGPFEWLWRSLARWQPQPMRRTSAPA